MPKPSDEALSDAFWSVAGQLRRGSREALAPWDLNPSQLRALRVLERDGSMRLRELADHLRIAPRSVTEVVDGLEARRLVARAPDPRDRRATLVALAPAGEKVFAAIRSERGSQAEQFFDRLSKTDRAHLARILRQLRDNGADDANTR